MCSKTRHRCCLKLKLPLWIWVVKKWLQRMNRKKKLEKLKRPLTMKMRKMMKSQFLKLMRKLSGSL